MCNIDCLFDDESTVIIRLFGTERKAAVQRLASVWKSSFGRIRKIAKRGLLASSYPSVRPHGKTWLRLDGFS